MNSKQPLSPRLKFHELVNTYPSFADLCDLNRKSLMQLVRNNDFLLKLNGLSFYRQRKKILSVYGFDFKKESYSSFKRGNKVTCSSICEWCLSSYWGLTPDELRSLDTSYDLSYIRPIDLFLAKNP